MTFEKCNGKQYCRTILSYQASDTLHHVINDYERGILDPWSLAFQLPPSFLHKLSADLLIVSKEKFLLHSHFAFTYFTINNNKSNIFPQITVHIIKFNFIKFSNYFYNNKKFEQNDWQRDNK